MIDIVGSKVRFAVLASVSPLTEIPLAGLGLGVGSFASPTPHGPRSSPTPWGSHLCPATTAPLTVVRITRGLYPLTPPPSEA